MTRTLLFFHLLGAAVWLGGTITVGALVPALRNAGVDRPQLQAMARRFGKVSWAAMGLAVVFGTWLVAETGRTWDELTLKAGLVILAVVLAAVHQFTARRMSAAQRGSVQGLILVVSLAVFAVATGIE
jgi:putative copper export protein